MRPFTKSIAWKLQLWHAVILAVVVLGLSTAWYLQSHRAKLSEIDQELVAAARVLEGSLRGIRGAHEGAISPDEDRRLSLPRSMAERRDDQSAPYLAIWMKGGRLLKSERLPDRHSPVYDGTIHGTRHYVTQQAKHREVRIVGPSGSQILVGRDVGDELAELDRLAAIIVASGLGILSFGLLGGWWLSRSVLLPISVMTDAASKFSPTDMSPRIDVVETESELGELATVLNDAFGRVESSFEQQRQFAADASHELRTPLAVIQSQIELALRKERAPKEYIKTLTKCASASDRLAELVDSLLTLARLESGEQQTERITVRLDLVAAKCIDLLRPVAENAEVQLDAQTVPVPILGDRRQLERLVLNLLKNGITYNRRGGSIDVTVGLTGTAAELTIRDTGIGISEEDLGHVTKRFFRVEKARSRQRGGSGLGLPIAEQIIRTHNGALNISSTLGEGTTVRIRFDLTEAQAANV